MNRRDLLGLALLGAGGTQAPATAASAPAPVSDLRITRVRVFNPANDTNLNGPIGLSEIIVAVDTNAGITGIGQGGTPDLLTYAASLLIGQDPLRIEHHWQRMYRSSIYPAGREKLTAIGALDCALWDIKGKLLGAPVYQLLGGRTRNHIECYKSYGLLRIDQAREEARKTMAEGYKAVRSHGVAGGNTVFDGRRAIADIVAMCSELREGVGRRPLRSTTRRSCRSVRGRRRRRPACFEFAGAGFGRPATGRTGRCVPALRAVPGEGGFRTGKPGSTGNEGQGGRPGAFLAGALAGIRAVTASPVPT